MWVSERCHCYACASIGNCYCGDTGPLQFEQIPVKHQHWIINKLPNMLAARNGQVQLGRGPQRGAQRLRPSRAAVLPGTPRFYPRWEKHFLPSRTENLAHLQPSRTGFAPPPQPHVVQVQGTSKVHTPAGPVVLRHLRFDWILNQWSRNSLTNINSHTAINSC